MAEGNFNNQTSNFKETSSFKLLNCAGACAAKGRWCGIDPQG
jgi:hypothetical protein